MSAPSFDPFNVRLARDIRNALSKSFLKALHEKNATLFQNCAAGYLQQGLEPFYQLYIRTRLAKYEKAYAAIGARPSGAVLQQAAVLWDLELYFEMHELLEPEWRDAEGERRKALQGLIRACGMKIHAQHHNMKAARSMAAKARKDLLQYGVALGGVALLEGVLQELEKTLTEKPGISGDG